MDAETHKAVLAYCHKKRQEDKVRQSPQNLLLPQLRLPACYLPIYSGGVPATPCGASSTDFYCCRQSWGLPSCTLLLVIRLAAISCFLSPLSHVSLSSEPVNFTQHEVVSASVCLLQTDALHGHSVGALSSLSPLCASDSKLSRRVSAQIFSVWLLPLPSASFVSLLACFLPVCLCPSRPGPFLSLLASCCLLLSFVVFLWSLQWPPLALPVHLTCL